MNYLDPVELTVEKEKYAKYGVHKGMQGWICDDRNIDSSWLVNFPQCGEKEDIETLGIEENDLIVVPVMHAEINEKIKKQFENSKS